MNFISKSNQVRRLKQIKFLSICGMGKVKRVILWKFLKKKKFYKFRLKWQATPGSGKIRSKYENINCKEGQQQPFDMGGSSLLWGYYEQNASLLWDAQG